MRCSSGTPLLDFTVSFSDRPLRIRVSPKRMMAVASTEVFAVWEKEEKPSFSLRLSMKLRSACTFKRTVSSSMNEGVTDRLMPTGTSTSEPSELLLLSCTCSTAPE